MQHEPRRLAILVAFSGTGGVERMMLNLLQGFAACNIQIDLLPIIRKKWGMPDIPWPNVRIIDLNVRHSSLAAPAVSRYLRREHPEALMAVRDRAIRTAVYACRFAGVGTRLYGNLHTHLSASLEQKSAIRRWLRIYSMRRFYRSVERIIGVSEGVAEDTARLAGLPREKVSAIPNPVLDDDFHRKSRIPPVHPEWVEEGSPIIFGAGRLTQQKDFATLIRAFSVVRAHRECRLVILGEGRLRPELEKLVVELGLEGSASLPGFVDNPFPYMAKASLFVLSSRWEGSGNVITEALALGVPVVATDCPSGPREILAGGRYGLLTPVGDAERLAEAMLQTLAHPLSPATLREAVVDYTIEHSARRYLDALGFEDLAAGNDPRE